MDFDHESLLRCFVDEDQEKLVIEWCKESERGRSDIFEYRLEMSDKLREEGNVCFKEGGYDDALRRYFASIWHLDFDIGQQWNLMEHHQAELNTRKLKVVSNVCAAYLKQKDWVNTKKAADVGLRHLKKAELVDKDAEAKFWYRKGFANLERGFCEDAVDELKKAEALSPGDRQVRQALKEASQGQKVDRQKAREVWKNTLLSDLEKKCQGSPWTPGVARARLNLCCRRRCGGGRGKAS